jgi:BirA family biotin operon repressor/biotin-[acetyl-CoA-carboxylase] ligase
MNQLEMSQPFSSLPVFYEQQVASTMDEAKLLFEEHNRTPLVAAASHQYSGRGRTADRRWLDADHGSLLFTIALPISFFSASLSEIPLRTGVGVAQFLETLITGHAVSIKWPNDILIERTKVCGILCESSSEAVFIGVGLNCMSTKLPVSNPKFPPGFLTQYGVEIGQPLELLEGLLLSIFRALRSDGWRDEVTRRLYKRGDRITFCSGQADTGELITGMLVGIDQFGGIMIKEEKHQRVRTLYAGEIRE